MNEDVLFINLVKSIILELEPRFDFYKKHPKQFVDEA